jgi:hypothetical protein
VLIVVLAIVIAAGFGVAALLKETRETAYREGVATAERRQVLLDRQAASACLELSLCDQELLIQILDVLAGRVKKLQYMPPPVYSGESSQLVPALTKWLCSGMFKLMKLEEIPESILNNPWILYEQYGPIPGRSREYMEDAYERIEDLLQDSEEAAFKLLCEVCEPYLDDEKTRLKAKQQDVTEKVSQICRILVDCHFVTIDEEPMQQYRRVEGDLPIHELQLVRMMRPRLGPYKYSPYEVLRGGQSS